VTLGNDSWCTNCVLCHVGRARLGTKIHLTWKMPFVQLERKAEEIRLKQLTRKTVFLDCRSGLHWRKKNPSLWVEIRV
jgi:hypothetical protein